MSDNVPTTTACRLLALPAELRNRIWAYTMKGGKSSQPPTHLSYFTNIHHTDDRVIHMDHQDVWSSLELAPRLNLTITCKQIKQETELMFHANNTFLFQTRDKRRDYGVLEGMADWLHNLTNEQRENVGRIVVCSMKPQGMVSWAWTCAGYCGMDHGFVVDKRIDKQVILEKEGGEKVEIYESWGREDGHFCNKSHYLLVTKKQLKEQAKREQAEKDLAKAAEEYL